MSKVGTTDITGIMLGSTEIVKAYLGTDVVYQKSEPSYENQYLTFVALEDGAFTFTSKNNNVISYSTDDGKTWIEGNSVEVNNSNKIMWKGEITPFSWNGIGTFSATSNFDVQGNIMSLLYGDNFKGQTDLMGKNYAFYQLFNNNTKVVSAKNLSLPAETLETYCYYGMFNGCTSLVTAPELPAKTLTNNCYRLMFADCTSLKTAPKLPATTLAQSCYNFMFRNCTSLETAPELPATTLADSCYNSMFKGCTSLTTAPVLTAETLASYCYNSMFYGCTNLTSAPELTATTLAKSCYSSMFQGCTKLNYIKAMFTTEPSTNYTKNWVNDVSASGTFVKNSAAEWDVRGVHGIPNNWTVETASS